MMQRRISRHAGLLAALLAVVAVAVQFGWVSAQPASGPVPATTNPITFSATPVTGLTDGADIAYTVTTSGATKLIGNIVGHLCQHGFTSYTNSQFGYATEGGSRCVYSPGIVSGGLTSAAYEQTSGPFGGDVSTPPDLIHFKAGTGSLVWGNSAGFGPFTLTCDSANPCDLVVQVNLTGDSVAQTYFIQPLDYAGSGSTTTTTTAAGTTTTTGAGTTTTTTTQPVTTTTHATTTTTTTTTTTQPVTTTTHATTTTTTTTQPAGTTTTMTPSGDGTVTPSTVGPSGTVMVTSTGWKQDTQVDVTLHSDPVALGALTADSIGAVQGQFTIPPSTSVGAHDVVLTGVSPDDGARTATLPITVSSTATVTTLPTGSTGSTSSSVAGASGSSLAFTGSATRTLVSVALLLIALGLFMLALRERRRVAEG